MTVSNILSEINQFIMVNHDLTAKTVDFLGNLKASLLILEDLNFSSNKKVKNHETNELDILLRSIGKATFINCYYIFKKKHNGSVNGPIFEEMYISGGAKSESSARTKASVGLKIFKLNLNIKALESIISSEKVDRDIVEKARTILDQEKV